MKLVEVLVIAVAVSAQAAEKAASKLVRWIFSSALLLPNIGIAGTVTPFQECAGLLTWPNGKQTASIQNEYVGMPYLSELFEITSLGGGFDHQVGRARFSPDSTLIAAELSDGSLALWNVRERYEKIIRLPGHRIYSFEFNASSTQVMVRFADEGQSACCGGHNKVQIWDVKTVEPVSGFIDTQGSHATAYFSDNGRWIIAEDQGVLRVIDAKTFKDTGRTVTADLNHQNSGDFILGLGAKGIARMTNLENGETESLSLGDRQIFGEFALQHPVAVLSNGLMEDGVPVLRDSRTLKPLELRLDPTGILEGYERIGPMLSPDGAIVYASYFDRQKSVNFGVFWDTRTGGQIQKLTGAGVDPIYSADGEYIAISGPSREEHEKSTFLFNRSGSIVRILEGKPCLFIGNFLVTQQMLGPGYFANRTYHFNEIYSGLSLALQGDKHDLIFSPDGHFFFYQDHGAVHLYGIHSKILKSKAFSEGRRGEAL